MHTRSLKLLAATLPLAASLSFAQTPTLRAGAAMVDITPKPTDLTVKTDSIRDHLFVRAIVVASGETCAAIVAMDQGAVRLDAYTAAVPKVAAATGCPASNILISATHTHSGSTNGLSGNPGTQTIVDAIVKSATDAKAKLAPATVGYGRTTVDLNVNRDLFNSKLEWRQEPNPQGVSDKTLSVVEFIGADFVPIAVYINYAMHPINFYLSGVISADFPGEASRALESHFDGKTVALFTQGTSGDQNPALKENFLSSTRNGAENFTEKIGAPPPPPPSAAPGFNAATANSGMKEVAAENLAGYHRAIDRVSADVTMMGTLLAEKTLYLMRHDIHPTANARIWGGQSDFTCPGRDRQDRENPVRENAMPPYKDGADVNLKVSLLRIGDIYVTGVNGEVYTNIGLKLKQYAPASKVIISTLTNGGANSGYIYSDDAYSHLSFQVIGSRLKPGCAEDKIVDAAISLMKKSGE
ncbi:neutral/alkaline non-lysosomal ceramidase N-terminal domain-containing protein [Terriglobus roseus]|uniref:Neutral ceramidase n=1 Tax=Terriglobus roseus TaxID=392734 RepID=A0A1H4JX60_9BACT|nr:neutral/alkaline non-lysosomal ceramidase N-terminal domain-containing protein [Terriglobus roseus]SEB50891.1 Neutral/alkaline non-lysosomal ceramidase, N-terminal [Terriglobus roseus]